MYELNVPAVYFHVAAEMAGSCKAGFTHSADERLLTRVSALMRCHITGLAASVRAELACKWLLASMSAHMNPQVISLAEREPTHIASKRSLASVRHRMTIIV